MSTPVDAAEVIETKSWRSPTQAGFYVCCVPRDADGVRGDYGYVLLVGADIDPSGPWVKVIGSDRRVHASRCTSWTNMLPAPAGRAHRMFGSFGEEPGQ